MTFCVVYYFSSFGQKVKFCDTNNRWIFVASGYDLLPNHPANEIKFSKDTTIEGLKYQKLDTYYYVREDTLLNKIFVRGLNPCSNQPDTVERILFDYNWQQGDTIQQPYRCLDKPTCWVESISFVSINGYQYKVWHFRGADTVISGVGRLQYHVIEGIGCTNGLLFPLRPYIFFEWSTQLVCFNNTGTVEPPVQSWGYHFIAPFDNSNSCVLGTTNPELERQPALAIPNPVDKTTRIHLPKIGSGHFSIYNAHGHVIFASYFQNKTDLTIPFEQLIPGIYCYRVKDASTGQTFTGKFVKQ